MARIDGRTYKDLRPVEIIPGVNKFAEGSCLIRCGNTHVLCTASVEERVPPHVPYGEGWVTAEYSMLPRANRERSRRDVSKGKLSPRSAEIQRLVGRALRASIDMKALGERTITIDCDVLQGDGGTRTASVTGGYVALALACQWLVKEGYLLRSPLRTAVAAVSAGIVDDELLTLVNPWNPLPDDWTVDLVTLDDGHRVDSRCYEAYMEMINACKAAGYSPVNCSSYRTQETQQSLYDNKVQRLISSGMSEDEAKTEAAKAVAIPGTSEHQLGLAVDLVDANMQDLTSAQESTETQKWLMANSWRYGFIHRYPNGKTDITGIIYEPWHYRYVGKDAAQEIFNRDITLEEYLGKTEH